ASDGKMFSKSKGNGVDPLEIINEGYGADALRTYLMFAAPLDLWVKWDPQGVPGAYRFLNRVWNLTQEYLESGEGSLSDDVKIQINKSIHSMIKKVTEDIEANRYNTAISAAMTATNDLYKIKIKHLNKDPLWQEALESLVACIAPFAPHMSDELWQHLGHSSTVNKDSWPKYDEKYLVSDSMEIVVQVNGKVRAKLELSTGINEDKIFEAVMQNPRINELLASKELIKKIYIPGKLVSLVVK
ncbi:MAG: class I tRNA ligase family protein, partial [bacterium]